MWGQASTLSKPLFSARIIPTRVGTRLETFAFFSGKKDHPHACGDKKLSYSFHIAGVGSSPRVWGQVRFKDLACKSAGIIPTRVGTRYIPSFLPHSDGDHPHACGDKPFLIAMFHKSPGSSPRVWGQGNQLNYSAHVKGIIPTRVGTSMTFSMI